MNSTIPELNGQTAFEDEEEIVGIVMLVPHELPLRFHDHNIWVINPGARGEEVGNGSELFTRREGGFSVVDGEICERLGQHQVSRVGRDPDEGAEQAFADRMTLAPSFCRLG